jgi:adenylate cyclase
MTSNWYNRAAEAFVPVRFAGFLLDVAGCTLTGPDGREVPLRRSELALLRAFLRSPGRVLSRDHLLDAVAGRQSSPYDRSIDVLVSRLRHKIEADPQSPCLILTMPGLGYKFTARPRTTQVCRELDCQTGIGFTARPDVHSIGVRPFESISGELDCFAAGLTEELITALSHVTSFAVISGANCTEGGRRHGAHYTLEGSVRRANDRLRISARLIDTTSGMHLWADRFDHAVTDIFGVEDEVAHEVVDAIDARLRQPMVEQPSTRRMDSLQAYTLKLQGRLPTNLCTAEEFEASHRLLRRVLEIDPNCVIAQALLARSKFVMSNRMLYIPSESDVASYCDMARDAADRARDDTDALICAANVITHVSDPDEALALLNRALSFNPDSAEVWTMSGLIHAYAGDTSTALCHLERSQQRNSRHLALFPHRSLGYVVVHTIAGRYRDALSWIEKLSQDRPNDPQNLRVRGGLLGLLGRIEEAQVVLSQLLAIYPGLTISRYYNSCMMWSPDLFNQAGFCRIVGEGLRIAGLPK